MSTSGKVVPFPKTNTLVMTMDVISQISLLKPKKGDRGVLKCPKCEGEFHWAFDGPRAMRGACSTPNCLSFIS